MIYRYEIKNNGNEDVLYLYLDIKNEFSKELTKKRLFAHDCIIYRQKACRLILALFPAAEVVVDFAGTLEVNKCEEHDCTL